MFEVTIKMGTHEIDLLIPKDVTLERFQALLMNTFAEHGTTLPKKILLKIKGKALTMKNSDVLSQFGIGNGERIEIVKESGADNESI